MLTLTANTADEIRTERNHLYIVTIETAKGRSRREAHFTAPAARRATLKARARGHLATCELHETALLDDLVVA